MRDDNRNKIIDRAQKALEKNIVVLDTETTGLGPGAEIIEISCVGRDGEILLDTMVQTRQPIEPEAQEINGIREDDLVDWPPMEMVMDRLEPILAAADVIASYNLAFDHRLLKQSVGTEYHLPMRADRLCIMETYAAYQGEWDDRFDSYRWHRLATAMENCGSRPQGLPHGSLQNALGALTVLRHMAGGGDSARPERPATPGRRRATHQPGQKR